MLVFESAAFILKKILVEIWVTYLNLNLLIWIIFVQARLILLKLDEACPIYLKSDRACPKGIKLIKIGWNLIRLVIRLAKTFKVG